MYFGGGVKSVFENGEAGKNLARFEQKGAHFVEHAGHVIWSGGVESFSGADLTHAHDHHFGEATLDGAREAGVQFNPIEKKDTGGLIAVSVHPNGSRLDCADLNALHAGADFHAGGLGGKTEGFDHGLLACGGSAVMGAHGGDEEGFGPVLAKPIPRGASHGDKIVDPATAGGNGHFPSGRAKAEGIKGAMDRGGHIGEWGRNERRLNLKDIHREELKGG